MHFAEVKILESNVPSAEGRMLHELFQLVSVPVTYEQVMTRASLAESLQRMASLAAPMALHLSCHGDKNGFGLESGEFVRWYDFRQMLLPLNRASGGNLFVSMSSCKGLFGGGMAMHTDSPPFALLIGPAENVTFADAAVGYAVFYYRLAKGAAARDALAAMIVATGEKNFDVISGDDTRSAVLAAITAAGIPTEGL